MAFNLTSCSLLVPKIPAKTRTFDLPNVHPPLLSPPSSSSDIRGRPNHRRRATPIQGQRFVYPDPIPDFADAETEKFKVELKKKLIEDAFGEELDAVVSTCARIFAEFLHKEYGDPGTVMVELFTYTFVSLNEKKLPGAPLAALASLWAQNHVDHDWEAWNAK